MLIKRCPKTENVHGKIVVFQRWDRLNTPRILEPNHATNGLSFFCGSRCLRFPGHPMGPTQFFFFWGGGWSKVDAEMLLLNWILKDFLMIYAFSLDLCRTMGTQNLHFLGLWPISWGPKTFIFHGFGVQRYPLFCSEALQRCWFVDAKRPPS